MRKRRGLFAQKLLPHLLTKGTTILTLVPPGSAFAHAAKLLRRNSAELFTLPRAAEA